MEDLFPDRPGPLPSPSSRSTFPMFSRDHELTSVEVSSCQPINTFVHPDPSPVIQWGGKSPLQPPAGDRFRATEGFGRIALVTYPKTQEVKYRRTWRLANMRGTRSSGVCQAGLVGFRACRSPGIVNPRLWRLLSW